MHQTQNTNLEVCFEILKVALIFAVLGSCAMVNALGMGLPLIRIVFFFVLPEDEELMLEDLELSVFRTCLNGSGNGS